MSGDRDSRWEQVSARVEPDYFGRRVTVEVRGIGPHKVGCAMVIAPENEPHLGEVLDRIVREIDKMLHA